VENFANYSATYGSLGGIIVLMVWFYLSGLIIILGGEINALLSEKENPECK
jgi:membrane protein